MAFKRPTPKALSSDAIKEIMEASSEQTGKIKVIRSYDEKNFPLFDIPVNEKVLAYIPNHTIQKPDGSMQLLMDKFAAHPCVQGKSGYVKIRCTQGVVSDDLGLDGSCPFCDAVGEAWELVNLEYNQIVRGKGGDPTSESARETYKEDWRTCRDRRKVREGTVYVTFPIVVIDCEVKDGSRTTTPRKNETGAIKGTLMWYTVTEQAYEEKWLKALETVPTEDDTVPTSPAGLWAVLNYEYKSEDGKHTKMDSARKFTVGYKQMNSSYDAWAASFDEATVEWTPAQAMNILADNALRDMSEQTEACDEIMKSTRETMAMYKVGQSANAVNAKALPSSAESALASFGATEVAPQATPQVAPAPQVMQAPQVGISTEV